MAILRWNNAPQKASLPTKGFKSIAWVLPACMGLLFPHVRLFWWIDLSTPFATNTSRLRKKIVRDFGG